MEDFDFDAASGVDPHLIADLGTCRYLESATNILLIGPPGVGKTHLAVGLARASVHAGYRTYFTTAADLAARCHRAAIEGRGATTMRFYAGPTLLVVGLCRHGDYAEAEVVVVSGDDVAGLVVGIVTGFRGTRGNPLEPWRLLLAGF